MYFRPSRLRQKLYFIKMGHSRSLFAFYFLSSKKPINILQQMNVNNPLSIMSGFKALNRESRPKSLQENAKRDGKYLTT